MSIWPQYPTLYEINTWVWLSELSLNFGTIVDLSSVPSAEWDGIAKFGFDAVWFMGIWERSPAGIAIANKNSGLLDDFRRAWPISSQKTMSALLTASDATWLTNTSEVPRVSQLPGGNSRSEA